jgi:hypothetical protein
MGSIQFSSNEDPRELVLVGRHNGRELVMLGMADAEAGWAAGCALVDVLAESGGLGEHPVVIDQLNAQVRVIRQVVKPDG